MTNSLLLNLVALATLVPAVLLPLRKDGDRDWLFWGVVGLAVAGSLFCVIRQLNDNWNPGLSVTLWVDIAASLVVFAVVAAINRLAWRLLVLLLPYLMVLGLLAALSAGMPQPSAPEVFPTGWIEAHILVSIITLGMLTLAAVSALAAFLQVRALKTKRPNAVTRLLPPVAESEWLNERLLALSELVLGLGVLSGMATQYRQSGTVLSFTNKELFTLLAFVVIGLLLIGRRVCGVRGVVAARVVLLAYLLVILGYFGAKFVHQVLLV
jgi:ABC-type uncharacterized transport system permease subunit